MTVKRRSAAAIVCLVGVFVSSQLTLFAQSTLIPITTAHGMVFDYAGQYLYVATTEGVVYPYRLSTGSIETPYDLGGSLNGIDIARDDSFLLVAQGAHGIAQGAFHKLNLSTRAVTNLTYTRITSGEWGAWDVSIASNGIALATTSGGTTPLRQIDLMTNAVTNRKDGPGSGGAGVVNQNTGIRHSSDGTRLYILDIDEFTYSATTNSFGSVNPSNDGRETVAAAINRNGNMLSKRVYTQQATLNAAPNFEFIHSFPSLDSGIVFDAKRDLLYGVNSTTDQIIAYKTNTFEEKFRISIGENVSAGRWSFEPGSIVASPDGNHLALQTDSGIRLFTLGLLKTVSRKTHGTVGTFDFGVPLSGTPFIESRRGGPNSSHQLIFTFIDPLVSVGNVTVNGCGQATGAIGTDPSEFVVDLTNVCNAQYDTITLHNVVGPFGPVGDFSVTVGFLIGDINSDRSVNSADISQTKSQSGIAVSSTNVRRDINADGSINSADISLAKSASGTGLPTPP